MKSNTRVYSFLIFLILSLTSFAQDTAVVKNNNIWINCGIGLSSFRSGDEFGPAMNFEISYEKNNALFSCRFVHNTEFVLFTSPAETVWDFGLLYGKIKKYAYGSASMSCGISLIGGVRRGDYLSSSGSGWFSLGSNHDKRNFYNIGIPVEAQLFWTPTSVFGVGVSAFANLNLDKPFYGTTLLLQLGNLK